MATLDEILKRSYSFRAEADLDTGGWVIWFPDLPGCMTQAETFDEIGPMAEDAFRAWVTASFEYGNHIPPPSDTSGDIDAWQWPGPTPRSDDAPTITAAEAAQRLGVTVRRISALALSRKVGTMFGRYRLFSERDIEAMRERRPGRPERATA